MLISLFTCCSRRGLLVFLLTVFACPVFAADEQRVGRIKEEIASLEAVLADNPVEKPRLEKKLADLRQELGILEKREAIESRESSLRQTTQVQTRELLREKLQLIDADTVAVEARLRDLALRRSKVGAERLALRLKIKEEGDNVTAAQQAERGEKFFTKNEELRGAVLQQEAAESELALLHQAQALRETLRAEELAGQKPSLRVLLDKRAQMLGDVGKEAQLAAMATSVREKLHVSEEGLDLARQKLAKFDEELKLLEKQTGFLHRNDRLEELLVRQRAQKQVLGARLPLLVEQVEALRKTHESMQLRRDLQVLASQVLAEQFTAMRATYLDHLLWPTTAALVIVLVYLLISRAVLPWRYRKEELFLARRLGRYLTILLVSVVVAAYLIEDLRLIATTLGLVSAAIVISLQDVCASFFGWFVIMIGGKFTIGDRLEIEGATGDVLDIQLLRTTLLEVNNWLGVDQPTGRVLIMPNNFIFKSKVFNFSHGHPYVWGRIDLTVNFATPVASAMALFQKVLEEETRDYFAEARKAATEMERRYGVEDAEYQPKIYTRIADSGVTFSLIYISHYRLSSLARNRINRRLIAELETHRHIQLAFNTLQVITNQGEPSSPSAVLGMDATQAPFVRGPRH